MVYLAILIGSKMSILSDIWDGATGLVLDPIKDVVGSIGDFLSPFTGLISGGMEYGGAANANASNEAINARTLAFNKEEAAKNRQFESAQARINRQFQSNIFTRKNAYDTRMSNTAVQRRMKDLETAGINPILAGKYDASSPTAGVFSGSTAHGSQASAGSMLPMHNEMSRVFTSAKESMMMKEELRRLTEETKSLQTNQALTEDTRAKTLSENKRIMAETRFKDLESLLTIEKTLTAPIERARVREEIKKIRAEIGKTHVETTLKSKDAPLAELKEGLTKYPLRGWEKIEDWLKEKGGQFESSKRYREDKMENIKRNWQRFKNINW